MSFQHLIILLTAYKYLFLFPIAIVEGPIVTVIAGFLVSLGHLNPFIAYGVLIVGDLVGDTLYYAIGYWSGEKFVAGWGSYVGLTVEHLRKAEHYFEEHGVKTLIIGKLQAIGSIVLIAAGAVKMSYWRFILVNFAMTIPKSLLLLLLGYYFGYSLDKISSYLHLFGIISLGLFILFVLYLLYRPRANA